MKKLLTLLAAVLFTLQMSAQTTCTENTIYIHMSNYGYGWMSYNTYEITDSSGTIYGTGTFSDTTDAYDTLCVPSSCDLLVKIYDVSPYGQCANVIWEVLDINGVALASNITCDEYWAGGSMDYSVPFCVNVPTTCSEVPTGIYSTNVYDVRALIKWDNMYSPGCTADKYRIKYREVGTSTWSHKNKGGPNGSCAVPMNVTEKVINNLNPNTTYQYKVRAYYCNGDNSAWSASNTFTTDDVCNNVAAFTATPLNSTTVHFEWDTTIVYGMAQVRYKRNNPTAQWNTTYSLIYPSQLGTWYGNSMDMTYNIQSGKTYKAQIRTYCTVGYTSSYKTGWGHSTIFTMPNPARMANPNLVERKLLRITDLLGKEVNPKQLSKNTPLFYIYDDGTVEKRIVIE